MTKFSPKAHTLYWDKNFDFANHTSYLPGSSGWSLQVVGIYVHMHVRGVARILGKGVLSMRAQILAMPTYEMERSKFKSSQRTCSDGS